MDNNLKFIFIILYVNNQLHHILKYIKNYPIIKYQWNLLILISKKLKKKLILLML